MKTSVTLSLWGLSAAALVALGDDKWDIKRIDTAKLPPAAADKTGLTFEKDVKPLLKNACFNCHGEEKQKGDLRLDSRDAVLKGGEDGKVVFPGNSKGSLLAISAAQIDDETAMPPKHRGGPRGPGGPGGPGGPPPGGPDGGFGGPPPGGPDRGPGAGPGGFGGPGGPGGPGGRRGFGPPPKPLTKDEVALIRAWIDQGAK
jgi:hypothetical protein